MKTLIIFILMVLAIAYSLAREKKIRELQETNQVFIDSIRNNASSITVEVDGQRVIYEKKIR